MLLNSRDRFISFIHLCSSNHIIFYLFFRRLTLFPLILCHSGLFSSHDINILCVFPPFPDEYKSKVVCEEERMRLSCKRGMQIAVYSAMFGRTQQGTLECPLHHTRAPSVGEAPSHAHSGGCGCQMTHKPSAPALL